MGQKVQQQCDNQMRALQSPDLLELPPSKKQYRISVQKYIQDKTWDSNMNNMETGDLSGSFYVHSDVCHASPKRQLTQAQIQYKVNQIFQDLGDLSFSDF